MPNRDPHVIHEMEPAPGEFLVFRSEDGKIELNPRLERDTVWMTQSDMAQLFQCSTDTVSQNLKRIYDEGELNPEETSQEFSLLRREGLLEAKHPIAFYNLAVLFALGFRLRGSVASLFRSWASQRLQEYTLKGFALDGERLKSPPPEGSELPDYFSELLAAVETFRESRNSGLTGR